VVLGRDRLIGVDQTITMPQSFASNAVYPVRVMPGWLQVPSKIDPLSHDVDALPGLPINSPAHLDLDFLVLVPRGHGQRDRLVGLGGPSGPLN
jgi:ABC-2 type transport system permease protein